MVLRKNWFPVRSTGAMPPVCFKFEIVYPLECRFRVSIISEYLISINTADINTKIQHALVAKTYCTTVCEIRRRVTNNRIIETVDNTVWLSVRSGYISISEI